MTNTKIPEDVSEIYEKIHAETVWLHHRWACYSELFRHTPRRIELLNASAPTFFFIVQELIERDVVLSFSRLTDPARDNRKNENISLDMLQERLKSLSAPESEVTEQNKAGTNQRHECTLTPKRVHHETAQNPKTPPARSAADTRRSPHAHRTFPQPPLS